ncbi:MAG: hypothetical protein ABIQ72_10205 [Usitatibacter sp.]
MKLLACSIALTLVMLAGCSTTPTTYVAATSSPTGAMFCWKTRMSSDSAKLDCNWEANREDACESTAFASVDATKFSQPKAAGMCRNGQWLVMVQAK